MKLIEHLPDILRDFYEIENKLNAEDPEFDKIYDVLYRWYQNLSPRTADSDGLSFYEELLNLRPKPGDSLEDRRYRVILKLNTRLPYTEIQLRKMIAALCGWDGFSLEVKDLVVDLKVVEENNKHLHALFEMLRDVLPMNLLFVITQIIEKHEKLKVGSNAQTRKRVKTLKRIIPRFEELGSAGRAIKIIKTKRALQGSSVYLAETSRIIKRIVTETKRLPWQNIIGGAGFNRKVITTGKE